MEAIFRRTLWDIFFPAGILLFGFLEFWFISNDFNESTVITSSSKSLSGSIEDIYSLCKHFPASSRGC